MESLKDHLKSRHVDLDLHNPVLDEVDGVATFYLWNLSGQIAGYQHYRPSATKERKNHPKDGRYYTCVKSPTVAVFGVESLHLTPQVVFVTEGIFDAVRITDLGVSAVAVLSNNPSTDVSNWLGSLGKLVVTVCDNNAAGRKLAKFGDVSIVAEGLDLGESSDEFVRGLVAKFVLPYNSLKAESRV